MAGRYGTLADAVGSVQSTDAERAEFRDRLARAKLTELERLTLEAYFCEGRSYAQIAAIRGVCKNAVVGCVQSGISKLRRA
jgi:DNA-directed RNA polymerase specialized sigma24 family protein